MTPPTVNDLIATAPLPFYLMFLRPGSCCSLSPSLSSIAPRRRNRGKGENHCTAEEGGRRTKEEASSITTCLLLTEVLFWYIYCGKMFFYGSNGCKDVFSSYARRCNDKLRSIKSETNNTVCYN